MRVLRCLLIVSILMALSPALKATHIVGGEMTYRCLGNNEYLITLVIFRDCFFGNPAAGFDSPASIGIFNGANNAYLRQVLVFPMGNDTLQPILSGECFVAPPTVCVHTTTYQASVELPPIPGGYILSYQRCCRNQTIVNIVNPLATGATYSVAISESALLQCNSSPTFSQWPPIYICAGVPINFDHSATDIDGDSIVYRLCEPLRGATQANPMPQPPNPPPYLPVTWVSPPYGVNNMLNGTPGDPPLLIHPVTGLLTGFPNTIGQFVVGICVEEYRNGQLIGTLRRDFQYNVGVCGQTNSAFFAPELQCGSLTVNFQNLSANADNFSWYFNDPAQPGANSSLENPSFTFADTGRYTVMLVADPNSVCQDTAYREIYLQPNSIFPAFDVDITSCNTDSANLVISNMSFDAVSQIVSNTWTLLPGNLQDTVANPVFTLRQSGSYEILLKLLAANGCTAESRQTIVLNLIQIEPPDPVAICRGDTAIISLRNLGSSPLSFSWQPTGAIIQGAGTSSVRVSPAANTIISVRVENADGCAENFEIPVAVSDFQPLLSASASPDTIAPGESSQLEATQRADYLYSWSPPLTLNNAGIFNPVATPLQTTTYTVRVRDSQGCANSALVTVVVRDPVCERPNIYVPNGFSPNGDGRNDLLFVRGNGIDEMDFTIFNRWGERVFQSDNPSVGWDGTFRGKQLPPDVFAYYLRVRCFNGQEYFEKGNITLIR